MVAPLVAMGIGAGLGGLFGGIFGGKPKQQTQSWSFDPATIAYLQRARGGAGDLFDSYRSGYMNPALAGARGLYQQAGRGLDFGMQTGLGGIGDYFNPFESEVIAGMQADFDRQRGLARAGAADVATREGAFGGSRSAILEAMGQRDIGQLEGQQLGQFRYGGYQDAVNQLMGERARMAGLGQFGASGLAGIGQHMDQRTLQALQMMGAFSQPTSGTSTSTIPGDRMRDIFGGALTGASLGLGAAGPASAAGFSAGGGWPSFGQSFNPRPDYFGSQWQPGQFGNPYGRGNNNPWGAGQ